MLISITSYSTLEYESPRNIFNIKEYHIGMEKYESQKLDICTSDYFASFRIMTEDGPKELFKVDKKLLLKIMEDIKNET